MIKKCTKCFEDKQLLEFYKHKHGKFGVDSVCKACVRIYQDKNKENIIKYRHEYYLKNKENIQVKNLKWFEENREKDRQRSRQYRMNNKDVIQQKNKQREQEDINYRLARRLRTRMFIAIKNDQKIGSAVKDLGCSISELRQYIESRFQPGMTWDNWGTHGWHIDHVIPLCKFDLSNKEDFLKACHYTNLQPMWSLDNLVKGGK